MRGVILVGLYLISAPAAAQSVKAGVEAWQRRDFAAAVAQWRPLAEQGDADAAFNLGQAYRLGRGVTLNLAAAESWLERAARKDHADAQVTLGLLLFDANNRQAGLRWLKKAADQGEPRALLTYGTALFNGDGVPPDRVTAYALVSRAAAQGLAPAKATLAQMDEVLPLDQRKQGVALALSKAKAKPAPTSSPKFAEPPSPKAALSSKPTARPSTPSPAISGAWRVQLGAFAKSNSAQALFARLSANGPLSGKQPFLVPAGSVTRLQVGPFASRAAAAAACRTLSARGQACFPVAAS